MICFGLEQNSGIYLLQVQFFHPPTLYPWEGEGRGSGGRDAKDAGLTFLWNGSVSQGAFPWGLPTCPLVPLPITAAWPLILFK